MDASKARIDHLLCLYNPFMVKLGWRTIALLTCFIYIYDMIYDIYIYMIYIYIIYILLNYAGAFSPAPTSSQIPSKSTRSLGLFQHGYRNVGLVARFHHLFHQRPRTPGCLKAQSTSGDFHVVGEIQSSSILMGFFPKKPSMLGVSPYMGTPILFFFG